MRDEMGERSSDARHQEKAEKTHPAKPARHGAPERKKPDRIHSKVENTAVEKCISDKAPQVCANAPGKVFCSELRRIAGRNEAELAHKVVLRGFTWQQQHFSGVDERHHCDQRHDNRGNIEQRFAG